MNLQTATNWIQKKEPIAARMGAHLGLTGSCLFKGESQKDIDILVYPHDPTKPFDRNALATALGLRITNPDTFGKYKDKNYGRCVAITEDQETGNRFDLLFLS